MELFRRTIVKVARNCAVQKSEMRLVKVDCAGDRVAYNCRRCEKTCEEPIKIRFMNLSKLSDSGKLCKLCRCPEVEHLFQQFEWRYKAVKITTTLLDMKKEFEANCQPMTTEKLLVFCAEEIEKMRAKVLNLLDQVCARCPESTCSVDYLIKLLKSRVIYEHGPDYLVRLVTLSNLQVGDQRASKKIKSGSNGSKTSLVKCFSSVDESFQDAGARFRSNWIIVFCMLITISNMLKFCVWFKSACLQIHAYVLIYSNFALKKVEFFICKSLFFIFTFVWHKSN